MNRILVVLLAGSSMIAGSLFAAEQQSCPSASSPEVMTAFSHREKAKGELLVAMSRDCERILKFEHANKLGQACPRLNPIDCFRKTIKANPPMTSVGVSSYITAGNLAALFDMDQKTKGLTKVQRKALTFYMLAHQLDANLLVPESTDVHSFFIFKYVPKSKIDSQQLPLLKKYEQMITLGTFAGVGPATEKIVKLMDKAKLNCGVSPCNRNETKKREAIKSALLARRSALVAKYSPQ